MKIGNIFSRVPEIVPEEMFEKMTETDAVRIERIISHGQASPEGFWYDQERDEWVLVLQGSAGLMLEGHEEALVLRVGDWIHIPAHQKHRVEWTDLVEKTIWLAIHYEHKAAKVGTSL